MIFAMNRVSPNLKYLTKLLCLSLLLLVTNSPINANAAQSRIALVIGNSAYTVGKLKNPVNDADLMTRTLEAKGFRVTTLKNGTRRKMKDAISRFTRSLDEQSVGVFYYAGHGVELEGSNYLIPVDANISSEVDIEFDGINAGHLLNGLKRANNGLNVVILDACRNNPYASSVRSSTRGLTRMQPSSGALILYATEPGSVAKDGSGNNGVFTTHLVEAINQEGNKIEEVFKITARNVSQATSKEQTPYIEGVVLGDFYFSEPAKSASSAAQTVSISSDSSGEYERLFWSSVMTDPSKEMFQAYLDQYPNGIYAGIAEIKLVRPTTTSEVDSKQQVTKLETTESETIVATPVTKPNQGSFDITGSYTSILKSPSETSRPEVVLTQIGNKISGVITPDDGFGLEGILEGNIIKFKRYHARYEVRGMWEIRDGGVTLVGETFALEKSGSGPDVQEPKTWVLKRHK